MSDTQRPLGAQISHMLHARGVDTIFGIPGVHNVEMYRGIEEAGITHVLARHEQGAGFMADGYARATGKPGVAYVITGPGVCNIMTPMGQAYSDSVPMLVLSSCLDETASRKGQLHQMRDQEAAAATVCDWSHTARTADAAYQLVDRALLEFSTTRPRPKHIQVPINLLGAMAGPAPVTANSAYLPKCSGAEIEMAAQLLASARKPMFIFGGGACAGHLAAREVLAASKAASFCTFAGRGIVDANDPLFYGAGLAKEGSVAVIAEADVVFAIGTELAEVDLWRDALGHTGTLVRVDIDPSILADTAQTCILSDAQYFMEELAKAQINRDTSSWRAKDVAASRAIWRAETDAARPGILPFIDAMKQALPADTSYFSDMTQIAYVAKEVVEMDRPGHWHHPFGFGTLGYALPAAIGGKIGVGNRPVVAIMGDYGFHYTMQELGVAVELGLSLPIILWDNGKLKEIEDSMVRSQIAPNAVIAQNPDFCALARAFGAGAVEPATIAEFQQALKDALTADGPTMIYLTPKCAV